MKKFAVTSLLFASRLACATIPGPEHLATCLAFVSSLGGIAPIIGSGEGLEIRPKVFKDQSLGGKPIPFVRGNHVFSAYSRRAPVVVFGRRSPYLRTEYSAIVLPPLDLSETLPGAGKIEVLAGDSDDRFFAAQATRLHALRPSVNPPVEVDRKTTDLTSILKDQPLRALAVRSHDHERTLRDDSMKRADDYARKKLMLGPGNVPVLVDLPEPTYLSGSSLAESILGHFGNLFEQRDWEPPVSGRSVVAGATNDWIVVGDVDRDLNWTAIGSYAIANPKKNRPILKVLPFHSETPGAFAIKKEFLVVAVIPGQSIIALHLGNSGLTLLSEQSFPGDERVAGMIGREIFDPICHTPTRHQILLGLKNHFLVYELEGGTLKLTNTINSPGKLISFTGGNNLELSPTPGHVPAQALAVFFEGWDIARLPDGRPQTIQWWHGNYAGSESEEAMHFSIDKALAQDYD